MYLCIVFQRCLTKYLDNPRYKIGAVALHFTSSDMFSICYLAAYNWAPTTVRSQASSYLMDLLAYLQGAFITFEPLPVS